MTGCVCPPREFSGDRAVPEGLPVSHHRSSLRDPLVGMWELGLWRPPDLRSASPLCLGKGTSVLSADTLLCIKQINSEDLPCGIGKCIQYPATNHNGKEPEKEYICICTYIYSIFTVYSLTKSLCSMPETDTAL